MDGAREMIAAVKAGDVAQVLRLLESDPDLLYAKSDTGESALILSVYHGHEAVREVLLSKAPALTVFEAAAVGDRAQAEQRVEEDRSRVNAMSHDGFTPLHLAAFFGQAEMVEWLIRRGAIVSAAAENRTFAARVTPLHSAAARGEDHIAALLLDAGGDPNARDGGGYSPLHTAAANGHLPLVRLLLDRGAEVNARNDEGATPLAIARQHGRDEVAGVLIARGGT